MQSDSKFRIISYNKYKLYNKYKFYNKYKLFITIKQLNLNPLNLFLIHAFLKLK